MNGFMFWAVVAVCVEIVALAILVLVISIFNRSRKKKAVKKQVKEQHCPRCGRDSTALYPWKDFKFCSVCITELNKRKKKK
jgi:uncharacterized paraquat-inducible protein A